jgi:hypothetical protein
MPRRPSDDGRAWRPPPPGAAPGAVGALDVDEPWKTTVDMSQIVFAPSATVAFGVAPAAGSPWSSDSRSMSDALDTFER